MPDVLNSENDLIDNADRKDQKKGQKDGISKHSHVTVAEDKTLHTEHDTRKTYIDQMDIGKERQKEDNGADNPANAYLIIVTHIVTPFTHLYIGMLAFGFL